MPKANAIFLAITNLYFISMVCFADNWDVPGIDEYFEIVPIINLLAILICITLYLFIKNIKKFIKLQNNLKYIYIGYIIITVGYIVSGQPWFEIFSKMDIFISANIINIALMVWTLIGFEDKGTCAL